MMKYANICLLKLTFGSNHLLLSFFISCHEVHFSASYLGVNLKKIFPGEILRKNQKYLEDVFLHSLVSRLGIRILKRYTVFQKQNHTKMYLQ